MNIFDPSSLRQQKTYFVEHLPLDSFAKEQLKYKYAYNGIIQDFHINNDNSISLLFEELNVQEKEQQFTDSISMLCSMFSSPHYYTNLGEIGMAVI